MVSKYTIAGLSLCALLIAPASVNAKDSAQSSDSKKAKIAQNTVSKSAAENSIAYPSSNETYRNDGKDNSVMKEPYRNDGKDPSCVSMPEQSGAGNRSSAFPRMF